MFELIPTLIAALAGALPPLLKIAIREFGLSDYFSRSTFGRALLKAIGASQSSSAPKHEKLFADLSKTSAEMDRIVREIEAFTRERQASVAKVEGELRILSQQEGELKRKIEGLRSVPLPAVELFGKIIDEREKKSAFRDYMLFLGGVIVSAIVAVVLKKLGYG